MKIAAWRIYGEIRKFNLKLRQADVSAYASGMAFFLFLSLIPILIILCAILPFTPIGQTELVQFLMGITPSNMHFLLIGLISQVYHKSVGILSVAILITLWSAGKGILALMKALNQIHGVNEERGYFRLRAVASFYTVVILLAFVLTLCLGVFGEHLGVLLLRQFAIPMTVLDGLQYLRVIVMLALLALAFTLIYTYIPNEKCRLKEQLPGAVFVAAAWNIFSFVFSLYVDKFSTFSAYGTLGTIILLLLWIYFGSYLLLIGAVMNVQLFLSAAEENQG